MSEKKIKACSLLLHGVCFTLITSFQPLIWKTEIFVHLFFAQAETAKGPVWQENQYQMKIMPVTIHYRALNKSNYLGVSLCAIVSIAFKGRIFRETKERSRGHLQSQELSGTHWVALHGTGCSVKRSGYCCIFQSEKKIMSPMVLDTLLRPIPKSVKQVVTAGTQRNISPVEEQEGPQGKFADLLNPLHFQIQL